MRILSQENLPHRDLPYESTTLYIEENGRDVKALFGEIVYTIAKYESPLKAKKAMEMLRNAYSPKIEIKEVKEKDIPKPKMGEWLWNISEPKIEVLDNFYFQFPKDEEIEV